MILDSECFWCGQAEPQAELLEYHGGGVDRSCAWAVDCCEQHDQAQREWLDQASDDERTAFFRALFADDVGLKIRGLADDGFDCALDFGLVVAPIDWATARDFVTEHHRHHRAPRGWRWGLGCWNGSDLIGVAIVGRPVARMIDGKTVVEVTRLCVRQLRPAGLVAHACSKLYGAAAREAKRRGFERIITYTLDSELGTSLVASGWAVEARTRGGSWGRTARPRLDKAPICRKLRWGRQLRRPRAAA